MAAAMLVAAAVSFLWPDVYTARTFLFLSQNESSPRIQLLGQLAGGIPGIVPGRASPGTQLVGVVLESRTLRDSVMARVGRPLAARVTQKQDGSIAIEVDHRDPAMAAQIANTYPDIINSIIRGIETQSADHRQTFLQQQIEGARRNLERAEQGLIQFQRERRTAAMPEQTTYVMEAAVELQRAVTQKEIEVSQLRRTTTPSNPEFQAASSELAALRAQLRRLTTEGSTDNLFAPLSSSAELQIASTRVLRGYAEAEKIYLGLAAALAESRLSSNDNLPVISVLDPAREPDAPSGRPIYIDVALAAVAGLLLGIALVLGRDYAQQARRRDENAEFFAELDQLKPRGSGLRGSST